MKALARAHTPAAASAARAHTKHRARGARTVEHGVYDPGCGDHEAEEADHEEEACGAFDEQSGEDERVRDRIEPMDKHGEKETA